MKRSIKCFKSVVYIVSQTRVLAYFPFATSWKCCSLFSTKKVHLVERTHDEKFRLLMKNTLGATSLGLLGQANLKSLGVWA